MNKSQFKTIAGARQNNGFTLVEVLIVMILISMMGTMVLTAMRGVTRTARAARTTSIIEAIDSVIQQQYESYKYRAFAVNVPDTFSPYDPGSGADVELGYEVLSTEAARVRLMMIRDLQRMEMPDRYTDISSNPVRIRAACNPVLQSAGVIVKSRVDKSKRRMLPVSWYGFATGDTRTATEIANDLPSRLASYRDRVLGTATVENQGAECLYLIMATSFAGGSPAIDIIPGTNIGDTDGDGMLEILDGWGRPIAFVRWPAGYIDPYQATDDQLADDFDLFRSDYAYLANPAPAPPTPLTGTTMDPSLPINPVDGSEFPQRYPWSMRPLIVSAGENEAFGLALNPFSGPNATDELPTFSYQASTWNWPLTEPYFGVEYVGRTRQQSTTAVTADSYPDPYLRRLVATNGGASGFDGYFPGQQFAGEDAVEQAQDNLSNYSIQAEQ